jgi:hypothetical protein
LFNRHFLVGASLIVVDDADLPRSLVARILVTPVDLGRTFKLLKGKRRAGFRKFLTILGHAVLDAPVREDGTTASLIGGAVWDHFVRAARLYGEDFVQLLCALPQKPTFPEPKSEPGAPLTLEAVEASPPATILDLLHALRDEVPHFQGSRDFNSRLRLTRDGIELRRMREHVFDRYGQPLVAAMDMLVLDATPIEALVNHLTKHHQRLPDVRVTARLPEAVKVRQYATSTNGHAVLNKPERLNSVLAEVAAERKRSPVENADREGVVCFSRLKKHFVAAGFPEMRVVTFGNIRGTNALEKVERLHVIGRPTPPIGELPFLAQVVHFGEKFVSGRIVLRPQGYGGQPYEVDVIDYADQRLSALLTAAREDEILQAIHRGRLFALDPPQLRFVGEDDVERGRHNVDLVLHTSQPVPGLRVDELVLESSNRDENKARHEAAVQRIRRAVLELEEKCEQVTVSAVLRLAGGSRTTVTKVMREGVHTLKEDLLYKGVYTLSHEGQDEAQEAGALAPSAEAGSINYCRGGCGKPMPEGQMCFDCASRSAHEWALRKRKRRSV